MPELKHRSTWTVLVFVSLLCLSCALVLAVLSIGLEKKRAEAREVDRAKQILLAARLIGEDEKLSNAEVYARFEGNIRPYLTDSEGRVFTFEEAGIDRQDYLDRHQGEGYAQLKEKLFYEIKEGGYVFPIHGFGLWGPLYGYLALEPDADTVRGVSWYAPQETPGLGANIQDEPFLAQFVGKLIFLPRRDGETDFATAPLGLTVVKGKVANVIGEERRRVTAVDGVSGATATGDGVTAAYTSSLGPYRPLLVRLHKEWADEA